MSRQTALQPTAAPVARHGRLQSDLVSSLATLLLNAWKHYPQTITPLGESRNLNEPPGNPSRGVWTSELWHVSCF
jgi:hypothetical protein